jgi:YesN/AraC family two-component response regulator
MAFQTQPGRFDAVLTDEAMPDLTGTELALKVRKLKARIPIILVTGYDSGNLMSEAAECGVTQVLRKPLRRRDLAESLARILNIPSLTP